MKNVLYYQLTHTTHTHTHAHTHAHAHAHTHTHTHTYTHTYQTFQLTHILWVTPEFCMAHPLTHVE